MELIKEKWEKKDIPFFEEYLRSLENNDKKEWTKRILNTKMEVLAIKTPILKEIAKELLKGNYLSFLDLKIDSYYECMAINGMLISRIEDFSIKIKYLDKYSQIVDNWSNCDLLIFKIKGKEKEHWTLAYDYLKSKITFQRRIGMVILFNFIKEDNYYKKLFDVLDSLAFEKEYYVNMIGAWLLCECFIWHRDECLAYLKRNNTNAFIINKGIQKCRDSYRVSREDKERLLSYKKS